MERPTWEFLRKVVANSADSYQRWPLREYILEWPREQQLAVALALSVAHWSPQARKDYYDNGSHKKSTIVFNHDCETCGLCNYFLFDCDICKLKNCCSTGSLYDNVCEAVRAKKGFHKAANKLYNKLVKLYTIEWKKL